MFARVVTIQLQPAKIAEAGAIMEEVAASPQRQMLAVIMHATRSE